MAIKFECVFQDVRLAEEPPAAASRRCWDTDPGSNPDSPGGCVWWLLDQPYIFYSPQNLHSEKLFFRIKLKLSTMAIKFECVFQDVRLAEEPPAAASRRCWDTDPGSNPDSPGGCGWWLLDQPYIFYSPQFYVQNHMRGAPFFYLQIQIES